MNQWITLSQQKGVNLSQRCSLASTDERFIYAPHEKLALQEMELTDNNKTKLPEWNVQNYLVPLNYVSTNPNLFEYEGSAIVGSYITDNKIKIPYYSPSNLLITTIGDGAFENTNLTEVTIPDSVTNIGKLAFGKCNNLTKITLGKNLITIGELAFYNDTALTEVTIPDSVTSIIYGAFMDCNNLTKITLGKNLITIGECAFSETNLTKVEIPDSVTSIGDYAFPRYCRCR